MKWKKNLNSVNFFKIVQRRAKFPKDTKRVCLNEDMWPVEPLMPNLKLCVCVCRETHREKKIESEREKKMCWPATEKLPAFVHFLLKSLNVLAEGLHGDYLFSFNLRVIRFVFHKFSVVNRQKKTLRTFSVMQRSFYNRKNVQKLD